MSASDLAEKCRLFRVEALKTNRAQWHVFDLIRATLALAKCALMGIPGRDAVSGIAEHVRAEKAGRII
jgi:hypothetical protein